MCSLFPAYMEYFGYSEYMEYFGYFLHNGRLRCFNVDLVSYFRLFL